MSKNQKIKNCNYTKFKDYWIVCIFLIVPAIIILIFDKGFAPLLQDFMSGARINGDIILNSTYAKNNIISPFVESLMIVIGIMVSYAVLSFFQKKLFKSGIYFLGVKKCLKYFEITMLLLAVIIAVYGRVNNFDCSQYGYSVDTIKDTIIQEENAQYISLEKIPSIRTEGIYIKDGNLLYNALLNLSQFVFYLSDNLEMLIAIAGAIIIPLRNYSEKVENAALKTIQK